MPQGPLLRDGEGFPEGTLGDQVSPVSGRVSFAGGAQI